MRKSIQNIIIVLPLMLFSCSNPVGVNANLNEEFKLKVGEHAELKNEFLRITFIAVIEDSRCPSNLRCFIPGNAAVALMIQKNKDVPVKDTLNTFTYPRTNWDLGYRINLVKLEPYPEDSLPIPKYKYVATFVINNVLPD